MAKRLQQEYMKIELAVAGLWPESFKRACAQCTEICCRPHMAEEVFESDWLQAISTKAHGNWFEEKDRHPNCKALGQKGCVLTHGKPPFCTSFYCDKLLTGQSPRDLVCHLFLSNILSTLCKLDKKHNLQELPKSEWRAHRDKIAANIERAKIHLDWVKQFKTATDDAKIEPAFRMLVEMPALLTTGVRRVLQHQH